MLGVAQGKVPASVTTAAPLTAPAVAAPPVPALALPPLPADVTELKFHEIFAPVGPRGLEYTAKVKALEGKRVRILGYMVKTCRHDHGRFLLTPFPLTLHDHEMGPADDLPPSTVFIDVPPLRRALKFVPHEPGLFLLTGTLTLGGRDELHGRRSWVRLELERPAPAATPEPRGDGQAPATPTAPRTDVREVDTMPASPVPPSAPRREEAAKATVPTSTPKQQ